MLLQKIIQGQYMSTVLQNFGMTRNLVVREALWVFEQENRYRVTEANANYELVMKGFIVHLFLPEALLEYRRHVLALDDLLKEHDELEEGFWTYCTKKAAHK